MYSYYSATLVRGAASDVHILFCIALQVFLVFASAENTEKNDVVRSSVGAIPGYLRASYERKAESIMSWNGCIQHAQLCQIKELLLPTLMLA